MEKNEISGQRQMEFLKNLTISEKPEQKEKQKQLI